MFFPRNLIWWASALLLSGAMLAGIFWHDQWNQRDLEKHSRALRPSIAQLERIGELATTRIHVTDILTAEGQGLRGVWLIGGDALLSCDLSQAKIVRVDNTKRTATIRLPPLHVISARIDHEKTRTWSVERNTWLPWKWGDQGAFRDAAMVHAQQLIAAAAGSERHLTPARAQAERLIGQLYDIIDWRVTVEWSD
ncbi:MAG: hypothetical protein JWP89_6868 [Schlesneria sp.]|nr:hypothetical protein [Schlesneria sp.]